MASAQTDRASSTHDNTHHDNTYQNHSFREQSHALHHPGENRAEGRQTRETPVVRRVDHIIIRIDDAHYDKLYSLLADTLRLPTPWPPTEHPTMRSGGIFAGNVDFEILYVPRGSAESSGVAQLYGIVFEAWEDDSAGFARRGISYLPAPYVQAGRKKQRGADAGKMHTGKAHTGKAAEKGHGRTPQELWMNTFLAGMLGDNLWQRAIFGIKRLIPDRMWMRSATGSSSNARAVQWMFNTVFAKGIVFAVKYNPQWRDIDAERRISSAQLAMRAGGVLGVVRVKEIVVGTPQLTAASHRWRRLLRPAIEETGLCWQVGDGPAIRLITADEECLHHMVWEVASLADARTALIQLGMLGNDLSDEITIDPAACFGLDIRLVEEPGGFTDQ